jgi:hypothetical protein
LDWWYSRHLQSDQSMGVEIGVGVARNVIDVVEAIKKAAE